MVDYINVFVALICAASTMNTLRVKPRYWKFFAPLLAFLAIAHVLFVAL